VEEAAAGSGAHLNSMTNPEHRFVVAPVEDGARLDRFLILRLPGFSRSFLQKLAKEGRVLVNQRVSRPGQSVRAHQIVTVAIPAASPTKLTPEPIEIEVLHEDADLLVICKPAGMVVHPGAGARSGTLVHALLARGENWSTIGGHERPGIVHRLDRGTSGVMVVARNDRAHRHLAAQFKDRTVEKVYLALVWGSPRAGTFKVDASLGRDLANRKTISSRTAKPRAAVTEFTVLSRYEGFTLLEARPRTGRTHQIRAHLKGAGLPIVGDVAYGGERWRGVPEGPLRDRLEGFRRLALHARRLSFDHPSTGSRLTFDAPLPAEMEDLIAALQERRRPA
jgi:23S rRNA pseudouridine1911/1915/1917 synthase